VSDPTPREEPEPGCLGAACPPNADIRRSCRGTAAWDLLTDVSKRPCGGKSSSAAPASPLHDIKSLTASEMAEVAPALDEDAIETIHREAASAHEGVRPFTADEAEHA